jgi:hypothetical protein
MKALLIAGLGLIATLPAQKLQYRAEWRLMHAGDAEIAWRNDQAELRMETTGFVGTLYRVKDSYRVQYDQGFCASSSLMQAEEGSKRREIKITYNQRPGKVEMVERDLVSDDVVEAKEIDAPVCVHDMIAGLARLRKMRLEPGSKLELPLTNGKKAELVTVEVQKRETVSTPMGVFKTVRIEALVYNGVLYGRKARLYVWLSEDERRLPVQIRVQMPFYIGTVTLKLEKEDKG